MTTLKRAEECVLAVQPHEMWQGVSVSIMQSNALKPFKKESKRIIRRTKSKRKIKTSFQIMDKNA